MIYLLETKLSENKSVLVALTYIYGIGHQTSSLICKKLGFTSNLKVKDLTEEQVIELQKIIELLNLITNNELKQLRVQTLKRLVDIKSYRGLRKLRGLPVRGQRTHTNAKSARKTRKF
jgi:small subunit ribosomal protein S13